MATRIFLLTSNPGVGKTTLVHKLIARWKGPVGGFTTEEIRPDSRRQGFKLITLDGQSAVIAALHRIVASDHPVLATLMLGYHEEVEALIKHPEARVVQVTLANRNELVHQIAAALRPFEGSPQPEA